MASIFGNSPATGAQPGFFDQFGNFSNRNSNALIAAGSALLGGSGLGGAGMSWMSGADLDRKAFEDQRKQAQAESERQMALDYFMSKGYQDLVPLFEAGQGEAAFAEALRRQQPAAAPDPFTLGEGQIRYDGNGNVIAQGPAPSPENVFNLGDNSGAFRKKGDELAATRLNDVIAGGQGAQQMMGDIQALTALGSQMSTGKEAELKLALGPYAQAFGVNIDGLGESQAYQAIIDRMAPQMRPAGSGSSSDTDVRMFLSSLPKIGNTPGGNRIITQTLTALQQHKIAAAEIAGQAFDGTLTWQEAEDRIRKLPNPYDGFNEYRKTLGGAGPAPVSGPNVDDILKRYGV